jgi:hypothetical protein
VHNLSAGTGRMAGGTTGLRARTSRAARRARHRASEHTVPAPARLVT